MFRWICALIFIAVACFSLGYAMNRPPADDRLDKLIVVVHGLSEVQYGAFKQMPVPPGAHQLANILDELDRLRATVKTPPSGLPIIISGKDPIQLQKKLDHR